jgi:hypothetical protein
LRAAGQLISPPGCYSHTVVRSTSCPSNQDMSTIGQCSLLSSHLSQHRGRHSPEAPERTNPRCVLVSTRSGDQSAAMREKQDSHSRLSPSRNRSSFQVRDTPISPPPPFQGFRRRQKVALDGRGHLTDGADKQAQPTWSPGSNCSFSNARPEPTPWKIEFTLMADLDVKPWELPK